MKKQEFRTGIYWGKEGFYLVESKDKQIIRSVYLPLDTPFETASNEKLPDDLRYTALLKKAFQENKFTSAEVDLSLNDRDIIFRSFSIPWMLPHEAKNVVEFEVTKYIPVPLEKLVYAFHAEQFTENNQKNLKILFFAVRKDTLDTYSRVIANAGLRLVHIEPNPVSIIRILHKQGYLTQNQTYAVIVVDQQDGKIIVNEHEVVQFVREFAVSESQDDITFSSSKIYNDIRVSLNFYTRQNPTGKIDKIIVLSDTDLPRFTSGIASEFGKAGSNVKISDIIKEDNNQAVGFLIAYSVSLRGASFTSKDFEFSEEAKSRQKAGEEAQQKLKQYKTVVAVFAACVLAIFLSLALSKARVSGYQKKLAQLKQQLGKYELISTSDLQDKTSILSRKLEGYKDIRLGSEIIFYLYHIPKLLPPGVWLKSMTIQYYDKDISQGELKRVQSKPVLLLNGYAFNPDTNEQFRLVTNFVATLKNDKDLANVFTNIERANMNQESFESHVVTSFQITCKQD